MVDFRQKKLNKKEWEALEVPVKKNELEILKLIQAGYSNLNIRFNTIPSLIEFMKITTKKQLFHGYLYKRYCMPLFNKLIKKYGIHKMKIKEKKLILKKADIIRIDNSDSRLIDTKIYEFLLIKILGKFLKYKKKKIEMMILWFI